MASEGASLAPSEVPPVQAGEPDVGQTYRVYGNGAAKDVLRALLDGHIVRLIINDDGTRFVADNLQLPDGTFAMVNSRGESRTLFDATVAELGYGVAMAHAYVCLPFDRSLFEGPLRTTISSDVSVADVKEVADVE